ncbi:MAG: class I SAM-dependent methyltransferase [Candidatus Infernicultor aquiphilus]|uniref:Class I SAM-dependent methyltransferase n=1 Tax=Candidatus Infernicultor aquiphilus TaxID=1805029 RepID=A0A2M7PQA1_9BACT|nr:MAG: class I SAM-dependent methyltransferase [Candidatus Atribacteria bacterium CG08_land_8_20_14_0_20_33_29]PIW12407.1 MAG: class I SAM-dependent methyltransferase [Candidatus Atribacteria bacterium CG17_big_fil_post_rev_8_21_14_2_50_34_11]PIX35366.1 MAG: class I SAM-dependent methyltransferase [Candidatus Atribacteria bacterium CG_4_8_14_3_um_filter_34_18]PIY32813.1 MAG: class I SAM-dependent methyltransferase [Candidatus Atribacteria bacterium CG_4_10_14_3_um_filter_34_13]
MKNKSYYLDKLSAEQLKKCYQIAPPRVRQYLDAEIQHILDKVQPSDIVLELGCGYGRVLKKVCEKAKRVIGIDISKSSLELAKKLLEGNLNCQLFLMNAISLKFPNQFFDIVICIQNGISAFNVNKKDLIREAVRVTKKGGLVLFSTYSDKFWEERLNWFILQSKAGLIGEINLTETHNGIIFTKDGFKATTIRPTDFTSLTSELNIDLKIEEIDNSSIFYEILLT